MELVVGELGRQAPHPSAGRRPRALGDHVVGQPAGGRVLSGPRASLRVPAGQRLRFLSPPCRPQCSTLRIQQVLGWVLLGHLPPCPLAKGVIPRALPGLSEVHLHPSEKSSSAALAERVKETRQKLSQTRRAAVAALLDPSCHAGAGGRQVGGQLSRPCPCSQVPSTAGKEPTGPGVGANKNATNAVMSMELLGVHGVTPDSQLCSLQPGAGPESRSCVPCRRRPVDQGHARDDGHSQVGASRGAPVHEPHTHSQWPPPRPLTGWCPPTQAACGSAGPRRWRCAACPWSSPPGWAAPRSPPSGTVAGTPPGTSCGSACPRRRTPAG